MRWLLAFFLFIGTAQAQDVTEIISVPTSSQNMASYNGWTEFDRTTPLTTNIGPITHIGIYLNTPCKWRPKIAKRLDSKAGSSASYLTIYNHQTLVQHPGNGWQWISLPAAIRLWGGQYYAGAYFTNCPSSATPMVLGRIEKQGDIAGQNTLTENQYQTPAMGVRYYGTPGEQIYYSDFDRSDTDGWNANATSIGVANGVFSSSGWWDDHNHETGTPSSIGKTLVLFGFRYFEFAKFLPSGTYYQADLTGARVQARIRIDNWSAPANTEIVIWIQARHPTDPNKYANWALTSVPLNQYADGNWHDIDVTLPADPGAWTYGGGVGQYSYLDLEITLAHVLDLFIVAARPVGSALPTGTFRMDNIRITYPN